MHMLASVKCCWRRNWKPARNSQSYSSVQMGDLQTIYLCVREVAGIIYTVKCMEAIKVLIFREVTMVHVCN